MKPDLILDLSTVDFTKVVADKEALRASNPQRFDMEQLDAVVHLDTAAKQIVGYKDIRDDEFWVRGHMPGFPLFPGVLMCEAAAQLCSFYCKHIQIISSGFFGFGGMEDVRFRGTVKPGDRLVMMAKALRLNRRQTTFETQGFVDGNMVYHGQIIGVRIEDNPAG